MPSGSAPPEPRCDLDLRGLVRHGDRVLWGQAGAAPRGLVARLREQAADIGELTCFAGYGLETPPGEQPWVTASYTGAGHAGADRSGRLEIMPGHYSRLPDALTRGPLAIDVALVQVTRAGPDGLHRLALAADYVTTVAARARVVIAEVNEWAPLIMNAPVLSGERVAAWTHSAYLPAQVYPSDPGPGETALAKNVASLVDDGATLQMGLGKVPEAVLRLLGDRRDLGIHTGTMGDAMVALLQAGAVTNRSKGRDAGWCVTGLVMGSRATYEALDGESRVALRPIEYTHDPAVLASLPNLVTVNSALEVDLSGQVNCEVVRERYVGAVGGALDFARGAHHSPGGIPVIALPSTAGGVSRIVPRLSGPATIGRADAPVVVTEHGIADLRGLPLGARREALIAISHPSHRRELQDARPAPGTARRRERPAPDQPAPDQPAQENS